jgi:hypothetical protein
MSCVPTPFAVVDFLESLRGLAQLLAMADLLSNTYENQCNRQPHTKDRKAADHRRQVRNLANFIPS